MGRRWAYLATAWAHGTVLTAHTGPRAHPTTVRKRRFAWHASTHAACHSNCLTDGDSDKHTAPSRGVDLFTITTTYRRVISLRYRAATTCRFSPGGTHRISAKNQSGLFPRFHPGKITLHASNTGVQVHATGGRRPPRSVWLFVVSPSHL